MIAGTLWSTLDDHRFTEDIAKIVQQIQIAVPQDEDVDIEEEASVALSRDELRAEFARLLNDIENESKPVEKKAVAFGSDQPAVLTKGVPELPSDFRETGAISWLKDTLLRRGGATECSKTRVGFFGMVIQTASDLDSLLGQTCVSNSLDPICAGCSTCTGGYRQNCHRSGSGARHGNTHDV